MFIDGGHVNQLGILAPIGFAKACRSACILRRFEKDTTVVWVTLRFITSSTGLSIFCASAIRLEATSILLLVLLVLMLSKNAEGGRCDAQHSKKPYKDCMNHCKSTRIYKVHMLYNVSHKEQLPGILWLRRVISNELHESAIRSVERTAGLIRLPQEVDDGAASVNLQTLS